MGRKDKGKAKVEEVKMISQIIISQDMAALLLIALIAIFLGFIAWYAWLIERENEREY